MSWWCVCAVHWPDLLCGLTCLQLFGSLYLVAPFMVVTLSTPFDLVMKERQGSEMEANVLTVFEP